MYCKQALYQNSLQICLIHMHAPAWPSTLPQSCLQDTDTGWSRTPCWSIARGACINLSCDFVCSGRTQPSLLWVREHKLCMHITTQSVHNLVHALKGYTCNPCAHTTLVLQVCQQLFMAHHCFTACLYNMSLTSLLLNIAIALAACDAAYHCLVCIAMLLCTALTESC